jgi:glucokinase
VDGYSIGVDLGGTNLRIAAVSDEGTVLRRVSLPTILTDGPGRVVNDMVDAISQMQRQLGMTGLLGVGVAVPGFVDVDAGVMMVSVNLPGFERFPMRDAVQSRLGTPIILENDGNAAALGERWIGAGRGYDDLILMTLGTGVGGAIISGGQVQRGFRGMAGEIGHITVYPDGNPCGCGNTGCLEKHASASAISAMANMMGIDARRFDAKDLHALASAGNKKAQLVFQSVGRALGIALANLINLYNFPLHLLSGGPLAAWDEFAPTMFAEVEKRSFVFRESETKIAKATLGSDAGLYGAAYLPRLQQPVRIANASASARAFTSTGT